VVERFSGSGQTQGIRHKIKGISWILTPSLCPASGFICGKHGTCFGNQDGLEENGCVRE